MTYNDKNIVGGEAQMAIKYKICYEWLLISKKNKKKQTKNLLWSSLNWNQ